LRTPPRAWRRENRRHAEDILAWGQNYASQEYGNAFDRALQSYDRLFGKAKKSTFPNSRSGRRRLMRSGTLACGIRSGVKQYLADLDWRKFALDKATA